MREPDTYETVWCGGHANELSRERTAYTRIDEIHGATKLGSCAGSLISGAEPAPTGSGQIQAACSCFIGASLWRSRPSAALGARLPGWKLSAILAVTSRPFVADFGGVRFIQLYFYAHRVNDLEPGVYKLWPERAELERIKIGDQRVAAAGLSLGQELAGKASWRSR